MDEELDLLEAELQRLRPRAAAPELAARLDRALALAPAQRPSRRRATVVRFAWLALPAAAAVATLLTLRPVAPTAPNRPIAVTKPAAAPQFKPVAAQNLLLESRDEGLVTLADGTTARRTRESYLDTITWRNSRTNASLTWSVPREEVRIEPVSYE